MATSRGPIKVGSGYIEINTRLSEETIRKFRSEITKEMERAGQQAEKAFASGMANLPKAAAAAAKKASQAIEAEAKDSAETLAAIEAQLTRQYGEQAVRRFREARQLEEQKQALAEETSSVTRAALAATVRQTQQQEREQVASVRRVAAERQRALEDEARMDREIAATQARLERERQARILETARIQRDAQRAAIQGQLEETSALRASLNQQLDAVRRNMREVQAEHTSSVTGIRKGWQSLAGDVEHVGTTATELGNLVTHNVIAPLGLAAGAAATFGIKSADAMIQAQTGLKGMGIELRDVNSLLEQMTQYGIQTPYSVNDMLTYATRYARANASHNDAMESKDPLVRAEASRSVAQRSADMVKMIGDSAAYGGILDPTMVSQGMYALEVIQDMGRTPLRNLKQLERATGIPSQQIAKLMGFRDRPYTSAELDAMRESDKKEGVSRELPVTNEASSQMMAFMADAKNTGGISGETLIQKLLEHWRDPNLQIMGAASRMGSATISGRIEQMKEAGQYKLGQLFYTKDKEGAYQYSGLGQAIMGKQIQDENGTRFEGGLLSDAKEIGKNVFPFLQQVLEQTIEGLTKFTGWVKKISQYLEDHPALTEMIAKAAKFAALMAPVLLGLGALGKILGKTMKLLDTFVATPAAAAFKGARGAVRTGRQAASAAFGSRTDEDGNRTTVRSRYRDTRTRLRGGDTRGPLTRAADRVTGRNTQEDRARGQMRDLERQIRETEQRSDALRTSLREVSSVSMRELAGQLAGSAGGRSVSSAAQDAERQVHQIQTQGLDPLNRVSLNHVQNELTGTRERATQLENTIRNIHSAVTSLDGRNLNALTGEFRSVDRAATDLYERIGQGTGAGSVAGRVGLLNGRSLSGLKDEFQHADSAATALFERIGQGTGSGSVAGRVGLLNGRTLSGLKGEFDGVHNAATGAYEQVGQGTGAGSLAGRIGLLNNRSLSDVTKKVDGLAESLTTASAAAKALDGAIDNVSKRAPGGDKAGPTKKTRLSTGGIIPGYQPGVDTVPALLSRGEAVLRPEVTAALGAERINSWNAAARKGQIARYSKGGIVGQLRGIKDAIQTFNILPIGEAALATMAYDSTTDEIGGDTRRGMLGVTSLSDRWLGSQLADRFRGMYQFTARDSWGYMKKIPTAVGQAIGILGGAVGPTLGDYFWDDVWKGQWNIVDRGGKFLDDTFSWKTVTSVFGDLFGGLWDSVKAIAGTASDLVTHPIDTVSGAFDAIWEIGSSEIDGLVDMVRTAKQLYESPLDYAGQVFGDMYDTAKEALPNTDGLFDFSPDRKVSRNKPDFSKILSGGDTPDGDPIRRWTPLVQRVLGELGLSGSYTDLVLHRIGVESGGNPQAINTWDSNAQAGTPSQGLMQTIPATFAAYAGPYRDLGIMNPLASIYAGLNYAVHRYGSKWTEALAGNKGYWTGALSASPGLRLVGENGPELVNFRGGERVYNDRATAQMFRGRRYEIHVHEAKSEDTTQATFRALQQMEALYGI
ncbi:transglycosylase SLT domain-containing protein [Kitasatospora sp. NPDC059646]|uniref:lytic transglycosylase domain-containing protein n=1 Tax=Kitasatospora sp. NPDC059646 TaxID=3346893 RepID=UPI00369E7C72